ncbi:MAG: zinc-binding dehydrogenase, partial [Thermoanaerobaculia bacterium]
DLIFDAVGNHSLSENRRVLGPKAALVLVGAPGGNWLGPLLPSLKALVMSRFVSQRLATLVGRAGKKEDLITLQGLLEAGKVAPVIDRTYPLSEVPEAIRYLEGGHARGKVVITLMP